MLDSIKEGCLDSGSRPVEAKHLEDITIEESLISAAKNAQKESLWHTLKVYGGLFRHPKMIILIPWCIQAGLQQAVVSSMLYRLMVEAYEGQGKSDSFMLRMICILWITFSTTASVFAYLGNKLNQPQRRQAMRLASGLLSLLACSHLLVDRMASLWMVLVPIVLLAVCSISFDQLSSVYLSDHFPGMSEPFSIFKQL